MPAGSLAIWSRDTTTRAGGELLGQSTAIAAVRDEVALAGRSDLAVLITGETGVGKELVARAIHAASSAQRPAARSTSTAPRSPSRSPRASCSVTCAVRSPGATEHRAGKFEVADGGTLFLDEIGELPLAIQPKLLRALQAGEIQRVGSDKLLHVDVRIIAATNRDLAGEVAAGRFRADLFHRLSVYPIRVPPLRERRDDISLLAGYFLDEARLRLGLGRIRLTAPARAALDGCRLARQRARARAHDPAGRAARECRTAPRARRHRGLAPRARAADAARTTAPRPSPRRSTRPVRHDLPLQDAVDQLKRQRIATAIEAADGNWAEAARVARARSRQPPPAGSPARVQGTQPLRGRGRST